MDRIETALKTGAKLRTLDPLVHCITSPIAINDCANAVLAAGARPIMAEHPREVAEITAIANSLAVSLANITDARLESIMISGRTARKLKLHSVIDAVGVTCSGMRMEFVQRFITECAPTVIKGNASEIRALSGAEFGICGIDTAESDQVSEKNAGSVEAMGEIVREFSRRTGAVVLASGVTDLVSNGRETWALSNGAPAMGRITGTGCILNCLIAACLAGMPVRTEDESGNICLSMDYIADPLDAVLYAVTLWNTAGELADSTKGLGTYHAGLLDQLSLLEEAALRARIRAERV